jgi:predicted nucleic acid-binding protein
LARIFADTVYFVALLVPSDQHRSDAISATEQTLRDEIVTSEPVLAEVLAHLSAGGPDARRRAVELVDNLLASDRVRIIGQTPQLFQRALELYRRRLDKAYSLVDCMSMDICAAEEITRVLTHDRHFAQEGLEILL